MCVYSNNNNILYVFVIQDVYTSHLILYILYSYSRIFIYIIHIVMAAAVGMIFVNFTESTHAESAKQAIAGRSFNKKKVEVVYYPEELYNKKVYCV